MVKNRSYDDRNNTKNKDVSRINSLLKGLKSHATVTPRSIAIVKFEGSTLQRRSHSIPEINPIKYYRDRSQLCLDIQGGKFPKNTL